jgi:hypothetical protein
MDHTNHVRLTTSELTPAVLEGATIYGADDFMRDEDGDVHAVTSWTKDELKQMREHRD